MTVARSAARAVGALLVAGLLAVLGAVPAQAAGYRYWSFWEHTGSDWAYATQGPSVLRPDDGDTIGFRFAVSEDSARAAKPRDKGDFSAICANTPAKDGSKRVAVVLDFGIPEHAPGGERPPRQRTACAQVSEDARAGDALAAVAEPLRYNSAALLCAIAGYPKSGCGEQVGAQESGQQPSASEKSGESGKSDGGDDGGPSAGLLVGIATVVVLGAAAVWQARRRA
ncbi:SCO2322 family protein [Streptomyces sp. QH1-20]|uniref:SCO2322 family protein n=1 Tax=Streptomyces sp. QH1-20 TaxID=3240934 RepID=UPI00351255DF